MHDILPQKGRVLCHVTDLFKFWEISDNISLTVHDRDMVAMEQQYEIVCGL